MQTSQTLERGLMILNCFNETEMEFGVTELANKLNISKTIIFRLLTTLEANGFLEKNPENKKYRLGLRIFELGILATKRFEIRDIALPYMKDLAELSKETVNLMIIDHHRRTGVCIETIDSPQEIKLTTKVGNAGPLYRGASRKILLAFLPPKDQEEYLQPVKEQTPELYQSLKEELQRIKDQDYSLSRGEIDSGAFAVASPIRNQAGIVVAGLTIAGPIYRTDDRRLEELISLVKQTATKISERLGWLHI